MSTSKRTPWYALQIMLVVTGCASGSGLTPAVPVATSAPSSTTPTAPSASSSGANGSAGAGATLPPVPSVKNAPLVPRVQYPADNQAIASRDSNFILGSIGSGDATLTINGFPVTVAPNGAFIGWLPNPPSANPQYELIATRGAETARKILRVRVASPTMLPQQGKLVVDNASLQTGRGQRLRGNEFVRISLRVPNNVAKWPWVEIVSTKSGIADTSRVPMVWDGAARDLMASAGSPAYKGDGPALSPGDFTVTAEIAADRLAPSLVNSARATISTKVVVVRGVDTVRVAVAPPEVTDPSRRVLGVLKTTAAFESDTDRVVIGRPIPEGTYKWMLFPGTPVEITGKQGDFTRVRLDANLEVWVQNTDVAALDSATPMPRRVSGGMRVNPAKDWSGSRHSNGQSRAVSR